MASLRRLLPYLTRYRVAFWAGIGGLLAARVFEAGIPWLLKHGIDRVAAADPSLLGPALGILACVAARFACIVVSRRLIRRLGVAVAYDLRKRVFAHLQRQGPYFFGRHGIGDLMARSINDIQLVRQLVGMGTRTILVLFFSAGVGMAFMLSESPALTALLLPPLPVITAMAWWLGRRVYRESTAVQEGFSTLSDRTQENLNGIRTVQALGQEAHEIRRFEALNDSYADRYYRLTATNSLLSAWMPSLGAACTLVILGFGGSRVLAGELSLGTFASFFWYVGMVLWPVREAGNMVNLVERGAAATTRLFEILDHVPEVADRAGAREAPVRGAIRIRGLRYRYPGAAAPALDGIDLDVAPGQTVALIGPVGAGKSTLLKLLVRLLEDDGDAIRLDGRPLAERPLAQLRRDVALVPQDPFLFADSLGRNVAYHDPDLPLLAVEQALVDADLADTVERLPLGLETEIGERGITLSGGQKQRATLARGFVRDAPVLLLDDCFSSLDTGTEDQILRRLAALRQGRTTLLVSHRVSTVQHADQIVVLDRGRVVERGRHAELLARDGPYAALAAAQSRRGELVEQLAGADDEPGGGARVG